MMDEEHVFWTFLFSASFFLVGGKNCPSKEVGIVLPYA